jgi:Alpha/beta hydrolase domain
MYTLGIGQPDHGTTPAAAQQLFYRMQHPINEPLPGILPPCGLPVNSGPHHWVVQASLHHLVDWTASGTTPPASQYLTTVGTPTSALVLDANGNATGGVRSPHVDTPVATIRGTGQPPSNLFCSLFGTTAPFSDATLETLYEGQDAFWAAWNAAVDDAVANGFVLAADEPKLKFLPEPGAMLSVAVGLLALAGLRRMQARAGLPRAYRRQLPSDLSLRSSR